MKKPITPQSIRILHKQVKFLEAAIKNSINIEEAIFLRLKLTIYKRKLSSNLRIYLRQIS